MQEERNCGNRLGLKHTAVTEYAPEVKQEHKEKGAKKVWKLGKIRLYECPVTWISRDTRLIIDQVFLIAETPALLYPGSWMDQPNWFVEAWNIYKKAQYDELKSKKNG